MIKLLKGYMIILLLFSFFACSQNAPVKNDPVLRKVGMEALPCWLYELPPDGDYVVGIATRNFEREIMQDAARQMAAVMQSRNRASYTINKFARTSGSDRLREGDVRFQLNVAEPGTTRKIYENLELIDETFLYDNYLALFSVTNSEIAESYCQKMIINFPDWYEQDAIILSEEEVLSHASGSSHNLATAWEKAAEKARLQLAEYLEKDIQSYVLSLNENIKKQIAIESTRKLIDMRIDRSFIVMKNFDSLISYEVYLELRMDL